MSTGELVGLTDLQFSVAMGFTSNTTTVTLRTARVLATSSPIPDEPGDSFSLREAVRNTIQGRTSGDYDELLAPVKAARTEKKVTLVAIQARTPPGEPCRTVYE